ncbi:MAG: geranylgeranylglycerol-phosphate geranylgeranyltransferase [Ignavibacterium sp.]
MNQNEYSNISRIIGIIKITRPLNVLFAFLVIITASLIALQTLIPQNEIYLIKIILGGISGALVAASGNIINDIFDIEIDKINKPNRILPKGILTKRVAFILYVFFNFVAIIISIFINQITLLIVLITISLLFFYSYKLKKIPLIGNFVIATLTALAFIFGGAIVNNISNVIIPALFALLINLIREIVKDMEDVLGDEKENVLTFPLRYGLKKTKIIVSILTILLIFSTLIIFIFKFYKIEFFIFVMLIVNPLMIYILKSIYDDDSIKNLSRISSLLKLNMVFGLIAIILGQ